MLMEMAVHSQIKDRLGWGERNNFIRITLWLFIAKPLVVSNTPQRSGKSYVELSMLLKVCAGWSTEVITTKQYLFATH